MKHSFRQKIKTLRLILKEYALYFRYFDECTCYMPEISISKFILINYHLNKKEIIKTDNEYLSRPFKIIKAPTICIYFTNKSNERAFESLKRFIPIVYIDKTIKRYRAKLFNEKKKYTREGIKMQEQANIIPDWAYSIQNLK